MLTKLSEWLLRLWGFRIKGWKPPVEKKYIMIAIPHTSNWDFPLGVLVRKVIGADVRFLGKSSLFKPPFGFIFYWLNGYPVERDKSTNFVDAVVKAYNSKESFVVQIAPEGTRKKVDKLKTGFYYIALKAKIPIMMVRFDWEKRIVAFSDMFYPSGDKEKDFEFIKAYFKDTRGKYPEQGWPYSLVV